MKHNLEHFSELMEPQLTEEVKEIGTLIWKHFQLSDSCCNFPGTNFCAVFSKLPKALDDFIPCKSSNALGL